MAEIICVGSAVLEQVYEVAALASETTTILAHGYRQTGAGLAADAAVATSRLGGSVALWSPLGDDETGDLIVADLDRHGVDTSAVRRMAGGQSPLSSAVVAADGRRQVTRFVGAGLPDDPAWLPIGRIQDCNAVLADTAWTAGAHAALLAARDQNRPRILAVDDATEAPDGDIARLASHILFTRNALVRFTGDANPDTALAAAANRTGAIAAVTGGTDGTQWCVPGDPPQSLPPLPDTVIDPSGSRETFAGAFALAISEEKPLSTAIAFATTAAGLTAAGRGARRAMPDRRTVWRRLVATFPDLADTDD